MKKIILPVFFLLVWRNTFSQLYYAYHPGAVKEIANTGDHVTVNFINYLGGSECSHSISPFSDFLRFNIQEPVPYFHGVDSLFYDDFFVVSNEYNVAYDSTIFSDTNVIRQYYDSSVNFTYYNDNDIFILDHTLDADSNYHFIGYSLNNYSNGASMDPNKLLYFTTSGITKQDSNYFYLYTQPVFTTHVPGQMTHHTIIDTLLNNDMYSPEGRILPSADGAYWAILKTLRTFGAGGYNHQFKILKIDSTGTILSDTILMGTGNHQYVNAWSVDTIFHSIYVGINDDIETFMWQFDSLGNFKQKIIFDNWEDVQQFIAVKKQGYVYERWGTDSSAINYVNESGDTIKTVYFPSIFKNDIIQTADHRYVQLDISIYQDTAFNVHNNFIITTYDSTGKFLKQLTTPILLVYYWESSLPIVDKIYSAIDPFGNIQYYTNFFTEESSHCNGLLANGGVFNIGYINQVNGQVTIDSVAVEGAQVELVLNGHSYFTTSDDSGRYFFAPLDTGHGIIILHLDLNPQYENTGNDTIPVIISDTNANPVVNYLLRARTTSIAFHSKIKTSIYPNPFNTYTTLSFDYDKRVKLSILSVDGKTVRRYSDLNHDVRIEKGLLPGGLYFYELHDEVTDEVLTTGKMAIH